MISAEAISFQPMNRLVLVGARYSRSPAPLPGSYFASLRAAQIEARATARACDLRYCVIASGSGNPVGQFLHLIYRSGNVV
jgi:hypothetical protein